MKYIIVCLFISFNAYSQDSISRIPIEFYASTFIATSSGNDFNQDSYTGIEAGIYVKNLAFGISTGCGNLKTISSDNASNYWFETKTYIYFPLGSVKGFGVAGWGQYYNTSQSFIEYGGGLVYSIKKFDVSLTVSNWDNQFYIAPGITYNFKL